MRKSVTAHPRSPDAGDIAIGKRIRQRRIERSISQETLGEALGVSFQQVQKYEKGVNRVGAGRLQQICKALDCDVSFFFQGDRPATTSVLDDFMTSRDGLLIAEAFGRIDEHMRHTIARFVDGISRGAAGLMQPAE